MHILFLHALKSTYANLNSVSFNCLERPELVAPELFNYLRYGGRIAVYFNLEALAAEGLFIEHCLSIH